jgi:hypothetical protein
MQRAWRTALGLLLLYAAPLAAFWNGLVKTKPQVAVLLSIAWLAITAVGWLFWRVTAESINKRLTSWSSGFDRVVDQHMSRYANRYREWVMDSRRFLDAKGLATVGTFSPELDEVFVDVGLTSRAPQQVPSDLLGSVAGSDTGRQSIWHFLDQPKPKVLAVIGAPGSGKTTLLSHVARRTARTARESRRPIPVLLQLRDHAGVIAQESDITLPELIRRAAPKLPVAEPAGWWESRLSKGKCIVLLDGLDEVAGETHRRDVVAWVNAQIAVYPGNDFVVTSRPHGYRDAFVESATNLQVLAFTPEQVRQFLHGWYLAVERRATGSTGNDVQMLAAKNADDLLDRLAATPALYDLTINPLLLTMIANVHRFRQALPNSRADLYGEVCQVMLWRRQEAKRLDLNLQGIGKERILAGLAFEMMRTGTRDIGRRQLLDGIRPRLTRVSETVTAEEFLTDVGSNGLLVERERGQYAFAHLTFQEYLAAVYIREHGLERVLIDAVDDPWWHEVTLLYLASADADNIVRAALRSGTPTAVALAFECAEIGAELAPELRGELTGVLEKAFEQGSDPESRRLIAGVLAARHFRRLVPTDTGTRICPQPVTNDLYWLFRRDTGTPAPDGAGSPTQRGSARGMWSGDAIAFVAWINALTSAAGNSAQGNAAVLCRLPTRAELDTLANTPGAAGEVLRSSTDYAWCERGDGTKGLATWSPSSNHHVDRVRGPALVRIASTDFRRSILFETLLGRTIQQATSRLAEASTNVLKDAENSAPGRSRLGAQETWAVDDLERSLKEAHSWALTLDQTLRASSAIEQRSANTIAKMLGRSTIAGAVVEMDRIAKIEGSSASITYIRRRMRQAIPHATKIHQIVVHAVSLSDRLPRADPAENQSLLDRSLELDSLFRLPPGPRYSPDTKSPIRVESLERALAAALEPAETGDELPPLGRFLAALVRIAVPPADDEAVVDLGGLALRLPDVWARANKLFRDYPWAYQVLNRLIARATPILNRQVPITADDVVAIRMPALILAAEANLAHSTALGDDLCRLAVAAGVMRRRNHRDRNLETLILATA